MYFLLFSLFILGNSCKQPYGICLKQGGCIEVWMVMGEMLNAAFFFIVCDETQEANNFGIGVSWT